MAKGWLYKVATQRKAEVTLELRGQNDLKPLIILLMQK
jgi:hypothetical protein